jgi:hypothetical protein
MKTPTNEKKNHKISEMLELPTKNQPFNARRKGASGKNFTKN